MMRTASAAGTVEALLFGCFNWSVDSVVGLKLFGRRPVLNSQWRDRLRASIVFQLVLPSSATVIPFRLP